jgi:hypothetical protein
MSCFVLSADLRTRATRGYWFINTAPNGSDCTGSNQEAQDMIDSLLQQFKRSSNFAEQPLLLPILYVETRLRSAEQSYMDGFSEDTYQNNFLVDEFQNSTAELPEGQVDLPRISRGISSAHRRNAKLNLDIVNIQIILRMITKGLHIVKEDSVFYNHDPENIDNLETRVDFFKERIMALESKLKLSTQAVHTLETMVSRPTVFDLYPLILSAAVQFDESAR